MTQLEPLPGKPEATRAHTGFTVAMRHKNGAMHYHHREDLTGPQAQKLARNVAAAGQYDPSQWWLDIPYGTNAWLEYDMEITLMDDEERYHKGL